MIDHSLSILGPLKSKSMSHSFWAKTGDELDIRLRRAVSALSRTRQESFTDDTQGKRINNLIPHSNSTTSDEVVIDNLKLAKMLSTIHNSNIQDTTAYNERNIFIDNDSHNSHGEYLVVCI
jgi:hypothetical protein